ncbi:hypothetical protein LCGC14_0336900 [marine sediment metagenome]|uniref:Uncharacterized protein n=1 Tax=marine sediment metagenome TaxID=412755 RepID=A0A0F9TF79_9ZZZZ
MSKCVDCKRRIPDSAKPGWCYDCGDDLCEKCWLKGGGLCKKCLEAADLADEEYLEDQEND